MDRVEALRIFLNVAETESFSGTARTLGISAGQVSKQVAALEERLKLRLFDRSTRAVRLTTEGSELLEQASLIVERMDALETKRFDDDAVGTLGIVRITAPVVYGNKVIGPLLLKYLETYKNRTLRLNLSDRKVDLVEEGYDLAIRIGQAPDSEMIGRKLCRESYQIMASKDYLSEHGTPTHPSELSAHNCLIDLNPSEPKIWRFRRGDEHFVQKIQGSLESDSLGVITAAARKGLGIAVIPAWAVEHNEGGQSLQALFTDWKFTDPEVWLLWPPGRHLPARVRHLIDYLRDELS